ncbi:MAG: hypothetical protein Q8P73_01810 [bacterium]|nr:hypothetical protein [bacterium]
MIMVFSTLKNSRLCLFVLVIAILIIPIVNVKAAVFETRAESLPAFEVTSSNIREINAAGCRTVAPSWAPGGSSWTYGTWNLSNETPVIEASMANEASKIKAQAHNKNTMPMAIYFCSSSALSKLKLVKDPLKSAVDAVSGGFLGLNSVLAKNSLWLIVFLANILAGIGLWVLYVCSQLFGLLLGANKFVTHSFVATGWPFVQGVANLGFILALLFIAFATTLRIETFGFKRMLPRLLLAAILINFSLVIGGVLIDLSRVVMAILVNAMSDTSIYSIGSNILDGSRSFQMAFGAIKNGGTFTGSAVSANHPQAVLEATIMIWLLAGSFLVITVGLFVRYVALILLLIISPLAYLALAFPAAGGFAKKWWGAFLKYVFYGPIALFVLLLLVVLSKNSQDMNGYSMGNEMFGKTVGGAILNTIISITITSALLIAAAKAGTFMGIAGAAATLNFMNKQGKKMVRAPFKYPKTTAAVAGLATGGVVGAVGAAAAVKGAGMVGRGARNQTRDFYRQGKKSLQKRFGIDFADRDDKGSLKKGETSTGTAWADKVFGKPLTSDQREHVNDAQSALNAGAYADPALSPERLQTPHVGQSMTKDQVKDMTGSGTTTNEQMVEIVNNIDIIKNANDDALENIRNRANAEIGSGNSLREDQGKRILNGLHSTLREINRRKWQS